MKDIKRNKLYTFNCIQTMIFTFLITLFFTVFFLGIQPTSFTEMLITNIAYPKLFFNNYFPVLFLTGLLVGIIGRISLSLKTIYIFFSILGLINRMKIIYRDFPLIPSDLILVREAASITKSSGFAPDWKIVIFIVVGYILLREILFRLDFPKLNVPTRIINILLSTAIFTGLLFTLYDSRDYYYSLPNTQANYNEVISSNIRGFHYYFLYNLTAYGYSKPDDYNKNEVIKWERDLEAKYRMKADENLRAFQDKSKPHIIFVMAEAFTDISLDPVFEFSDENNPLAGYMKMAEDSIVSGQIVTPVFGGGTENTEYDVLTGNNVLFQSDGNVSSFKSIKSRTYSLAWFFRDLGYDTMGMHPGHPWFYNRQNAYQDLGLKDNYFNVDFKNPLMKGLYISEEEFANKIKDDFSKHIEENSNPLFYYSVNIQNHSPYLNYKYKDDERFSYNTTLELEPEVKEQFDNLFVGIKDMSDALKDMGDYFTDQEEPVILIYFGDHRPFLGEDYMAYRAIDYDIYTWNGTSFLNSRSTPFLIWANDSGEKYLDTSKLNLPEDSRINANYLGVMVLEMLGLDGLDPYYSYLNELRKEFPILSRHFIGKIGENNSTNIINFDSLPKEDLVKIENYRKWQYYRLTNFRENTFK